MTIAMIIGCLFVAVSAATGITLLDTWVQARLAFWSVFRQQQLLDAGFTPQVEASEVRLRRPIHRTARRVPEARVRKSGFGGSRRSSLGAVQVLG